MRAPSEKSLLSAFRDLTPQKARLIRRIAKATDSGDELRKVVESNCPETESYTRRMHSDPYDSQIWRVTVALDAINHVIGGYGVEGFGPGRSGDYAPPYEYINMGDTYATTLLYRRKTDTLSIGSWGDIAEKHPSW